MKSVSRYLAGNSPTEDHLLPGRLNLEHEQAFLLGREHDLHMVDNPSPPEHHILAIQLDSLHIGIVLHAVIVEVAQSSTEMQGPHLDCQLLAVYAPGLGRAVLAGHEPQLLL
jgi:hypothetical protein